MATRSLRYVAPAVVAASLVFTACGSSSSGSEVTPAPNTTPWRTLAPVAGTATGSSIPLDGDFVNYVIQSGDFPNAVAKKAGALCSGSELLDTNPDVAFNPGNIIKVPTTCLADGITEDILNQPADTTPPDGTDATGDTTKGGKKTTTTEVEYVSYVVEPGEFWFAIAKKTGCTYKQIRAANPKVKSLHPGDKIRVPLSCD